MPPTTQSKRTTPNAEFRPHDPELEAAPSRDRSLPDDLKRQAVRRLRVVSIAYTLAFFFADFFPSIATGTLPMRFVLLGDWLPGVVSIAGGILFAVFIGHPRLSWDARVRLGLGFLVLSSYGIAISQYATLPSYVRDYPIILQALSPSWVAVWVVCFAVVVPAPPRRTVGAMLLAALAAPVVLAVTLAANGLSHLLPPLELFFTHVLPYLICVGLAYAAASVVYRLGTDVSRARELGSYRLEERLGEGGMGEVWRASHRMLARPAAIKFVRATSLGEGEGAQTVLRRFELEAKATASLTSVHTIDLYDYGVTADGIFYYVMELLDGVDADRLVRTFGPLPPARVVHLLRQVADSLEEAHDRGLVHRDVKPANVYVCRAGNRCDFVKVLDFGLVTRQDAKHGADLRLTHPDQAIGTPEFMPPEIALGKAVDGRTDLYGVGCVAYWLLTGRPVFGGASFYEIVSHHLHAEPEPPSRHVAGVPVELEALVLRLLEKDPERRPRDARALSRELDTVVAGAMWSDAQAEEWWERNLPRSKAATAAATATRGLQEVIT